MSSPVTFERHRSVGVLRIHNPPVNALSPENVQGLIDGFESFEADAALEALVLIGAGRTFVAGGDITQFDAENFSAQPYNDLLVRIEACARPVVAALHGTPLGGGVELALACHSRVAANDMRLGLPEVKLGLLPGSGGTQRLPRLIGARLALDLLHSGRLLDAHASLQAGIVDAVTDGDLLDFGIARALSLAAGSAAYRRASTLAVPDAAQAFEALEKAQAEAASKPFYPAHEAIVECVRSAIGQPFSDGARLETQAFERLRLSPTSQALRHLFFAEREATKTPGQPARQALRQVKRVGLVGAGTMGGGIAMNFANAGIPVTLVEAKADALERGLDLVRRNYEASAAKGRLSIADVGQRMALLQGTLDCAALADCDLVIEAVFEDMALKHEICRRLGEVCKPGAIIATNTSTLDVDQLAQATGRAADVVGMHFFSPAHVMRLLEVVRGSKTSPDVLATAMQLAKRIGKTAVISGVCYGFIGNRMGEVYARENEALLLEGASPSQIDGVAQSPVHLGLAMGPCRMLDMAGIDVGARTVIEWIKSGRGPADPAYRAVCRALFERGQFGQKAGQGYYRYEGRTPLHSADTEALCVELATHHGVKRRSGIGDDEIAERLFYPMVNEAARILEEGIAYRPGDIDVVWTAGYGFPDWRGGPVFMADRVGVEYIVARLDHYADELGNDKGSWTVSPLLRHLADTGGRLSDWRPAP